MKWLNHPNVKVIISLSFTFYLSFKYCFGNQGIIPELNFFIFGILFTALGIYCVIALFRAPSKDGLILAFVSTVIVADLLLLFAGIYRHLGLQYGKEIIYDSSKSLYFSIVTWTTLGYGDFAPSPSSRPYAASEALIGYIFMAIFLAGCIHLMSIRASHPAD